VVVERLDPGIGGVEQVAFQQLAELGRRGCDVRVVCHTATVAPPPGVRLERVATPRFWQPLRVAWFSRGAAAATRADDVVHGLARTRRQHVYRAGGGSHAAYLERVAGGRRRSARLSPRHAVVLAIEEAVFRDPRQIIQCNARMNEREIADRYGVPADRLVTIYNGVDTERFHPAHRATLGAELRGELAIEGPLALFAGSGFARKGLDRAIRGLARSDAPGTLLVAGHGDPAPYRALAATLGVAERVRFLGRRGDIERLYAGVDLFVLPTRYDPFANVCLEAMAAGLAVATTPTNGAAELIEPDKSGWIGEDDFAPALALLSHPGRLRDMGRAARQVAEHYTWERYVDRVLELYRRVAA